MEFQNEIKRYIQELGISDVGFARVDDFDNKEMKSAVCSKGQSQG